MNDQTVRIIVKVNFLIMALVITMMVMSGMKKNGLSEGLRNLLGFENPSTAQQQIEAGQ